MTRWKSWLVTGILRKLIPKVPLKSHTPAELLKISPKFRIIDFFCIAAKLRRFSRTLASVRERTFFLKLEILSEIKWPDNLVCIVPVDNFSWILKIWSSCVIIKLSTIILVSIWLYFIIHSIIKKTIFFCVSTSVF